MEVYHSHVVLDACCILNFCASQHFLSILKAIPARVAVTKLVRERELKTLQRLENEDSEAAENKEVAEKEIAENQAATIFETAIEQNILTEVDFETEEEAEAFVNYVTVLRGDGESASGAIAVCRGWAIATDDKRAISFFKQEAPQMQILSTLEIVKHWSEKEGLEPSALREALHAIRVKGRYSPPKSHPLLNWWEAAMES